MSHKTGKRVLATTATSALAFAGLIAMPMTAQAATPPVWVNGCGVNDELRVVAADNLTQMTVDNVNWVNIPYKANVDSDGKKIVDLSGISGLYGTNSGDTTTYNQIAKDITLANAAGDEVTTALAVDGRTANVTNTLCTVTVGDTVIDLDPAADVMAGVVVKPTATPKVGSNGGTVTLTRTAGMKWTVNDGNTTQTFASTDMAATRVVTVTGANVTVAASPEAPSGVSLQPPSAFTWNFTLNGGVALTAPVKPTYDAVVKKATFAPSGDDNFRWYVTDASVTTPSAAATTAPLATTTDEYQFADTDAGKTKKIWAVPLQGYTFSDGSTHKVWNYSIPASVGLTLDPTQFSYIDTDSTDSVTVPAISGAKLYYRMGTTSLTAPKFNADGSIKTGGAGWASLPSGTTTNLPAAGGNLYVVATVTDPASSFAYKPGLVNEADFTTALGTGDFPRDVVALVSPRSYTTGITAMVPYPTFTDVEGGAGDSVTFPDFSADVNWDVYAYPAGTANPTTGTTYKIRDSSVNFAMGRTLARSEWGTLLTGAGSATSVNPNGDVTFQFVPVAQGGKVIPAGIDDKRLKETLYVAGGVVASEPVWIDNSGPTAPDFVKFSKIPGVTYVLDVDADNNGIWDPGPDGTRTVTFGASETTSIETVGAGSRVRVVATPASGTALRNADTGQTTKTWVHQFSTANTGVVPAAPVSNDEDGTDNDTYTIPETTGVDYFVGGDPFDASKAGVPQRTNGAHSVTITAQAKPGYTIAVGATTSWELRFSTEKTRLVPEAPQSHDEAGSGRDTYEITDQTGVLWTADGVDVDPDTYGERISTGGKDKITFVARAADGYTLKGGAETTFTLNWDITPTRLDAPAVDSYVLENEWQAHVEWSGPEGAEGLKYHVSFASVTYDEDGNESVGTAKDWWSDTEATEATFNGGGIAKYRVFVKATDGDGTESKVATTDIVFSQKPSPTEGWVDINNSTVTQSGWLQAASSAYFDNTAFVTYKDQSSFTFSVSGGKSLDLYGTQYTKGGKALIQVDGKNWAWMDSGSDSNADPYKKLLRHIGLPDTGTHTIKVIASLTSGKELALDAYKIIK